MPASVSELALKQTQSGIQDSKPADPAIAQILLLLRADLEAHSPVLGHLWPSRCQGNQ